MIIVMLCCKCVSQTHKTHVHRTETANEGNTRANTTFDRFCSFVNSHLTTRPIPIRVKLCDRRFDRYIVFYGIRVIDNKNRFLWFRPIFHHLIRGLLQC